MDEAIVKFQNQMNVKSQNNMNRIDAGMALQ